MNRCLVQYELLYRLKQFHSVRGVIGVVSALSETAMLYTIVTKVEEVYDE